MSAPLSDSNDCFALLDDSSASATEPRSRLYTDFARTLVCNTLSDLAGMLAAMQQEQASGLHAVSLFTYELGARMHGVPADPPAGIPLARILLFRKCRLLSPPEVEQWLRERDNNAPAGIAGLKVSVDEPAFKAAIERIHGYIEAGDTYQINYTYRLRFDAYGAPIGLYRRLRARQPVPYGALIALPDGAAILSLSPELFVRHDAGRLTARPMKGTAAASGDAAEDAARAATLAADPKNRAENLMIVDLLRNDLGRIARTGSVEVPQLFHVRRFSSVLQMTSTVEADLNRDVSLADVLTALYPCGSITGAPKRRTMQIIDELEPAPRGMYTGALGWFDAPAGTSAVGNFCLSVPIRTLVLLPPEGAIRRGELGVGAGIVHDSVAADEFAECALKARFLTGLGSDFELFETMHATHAHGCRYLNLHLQRLRSSAVYFNFPFDEPVIRSTIDNACAQLAPDLAFRLRLSLDFLGRCSVQLAPVTELSSPVRVLLSCQPTRADDLFLRHKTTVRTRYDAAWREAERQGAFDTLFTNEHGSLTEGGRSNLFVRLNGRWFTPPLAAGVLPGVMRAVLLADPAWNAVERNLELNDLRSAEEIVVCNALRGALVAKIDWDAEVELP